MPKRETSAATTRLGYPSAVGEVKVGYRGQSGAEAGWTGDEKRGVTVIDVADPGRKRAGVKVRKTPPAAAKVRKRAPSAPPPLKRRK